MRQFSLLSAGFVLSALSVGSFSASPIQAETSFTASSRQCDLRSEVDPKAEIQWTYDTSQAGYWKGRLSLEGKTILQLMATQAQGYGTRTWTAVGHNSQASPLIPFSDGQPTNSLANASRVDRFLLVGLGSTLYYRTRNSEHESLIDSRMLQAAEGFWRITNGCRNFLMLNR
jgi:hypothetical protein